MERTLECFGARRPFVSCGKCARTSRKGRRFICVPREYEVWRVQTFVLLLWHSLVRVLVLIGLGLKRAGKLLGQLRTHKAMNFFHSGFSLSSKSPLCPSSLRHFQQSPENRYAKFSRFSLVTRSDARCYFGGGPTLVSRVGWSALFRGGGPGRYSA